MSEHRWSGWPGAWCLDCGCEDPREIALANGLQDDDGLVRVDPALMACPEPGSNRFNPYVKTEEIK
jgi:hypothetical protein